MHETLSCEDVGKVVLVFINSPHTHVCCNDPLYPSLKSSCSRRFIRPGRSWCTGAAAVFTVPHPQVQKSLVCDCDVSVTMLYTSRRSSHPDWCSVTAVRTVCAKTNSQKQFGKTFCLLRPFSAVSAYLVCTGYQPTATGVCHAVPLSEIVMQQPCHSLGPQLMYSCSSRLSSASPTSTEIFGMWLWLAWRAIVHLADMALLLRGTFLNYAKTALTRHCHRSTIHGESYADTHRLEMDRS